MLFNSIAYLVFVPVVFMLYWFVCKGLKVQNMLVIGASYVFYGWWDWRFLSLLVLTSLSSYWSGLLLSRYEGVRKRRLVCVANIVLNLGILCVFKYYNFFAESLSELCGSLGYEVDAVTLEVVLPVGISFYTFQALSYTIDVYRRQITATHEMASFFAYISILSADDGRSDRTGDEPVAAVLCQPSIRLRGGDRGVETDPVGLV
jgi:D-alanyl-lipoteichoic acid acyltransferase DltB (MBOAT superfamily)